MVQFVPSRRLLRYLSSVADAQILQSLQCRSISSRPLFIITCNGPTIRRLHHYSALKSANTPTSRRWELTPAQSPSLSSESPPLTPSLPDTSTHYALFQSTL